MNRDLHTEHFGIHALNPFVMHNSSPRNAMFSSHLGQRLVIEGADESIIQTGVESDFSKYTFSVKMPENGRIIKLIHKYPEGVDKDSLHFNPETIVIYENDETKEIDYVSIPYYASFHQFFGFKYEKKETINQLRHNAYIAKDTIFADSPSVGENGGFKYGINLNTAFMSLPSVSEDGIMIARDVLEKLRFKIYETRVVEFGSKNFPLNLYGNLKEYKPFPEIGEYIRNDGILMMLRKYDQDTMPVDISIYDVTEPDSVFDKGFYVRGQGGKVVDVEVISNNNPIKQMPDTMKLQLNKYEKALLKFRQEIVDTEEQLRRERKKKFGDGTLRLSPRLHRLIVESLVIINYTRKQTGKSLNLLYRKGPVDEYRIKFVVEYTITPDIGFKLTNRHGGKGVICKIEERENMPVDADGVSADIVTDPGSIGGRMNTGVLYEHYINGSSRFVQRNVRKMLGVGDAKINVNTLSKIPLETIKACYDYILSYYEPINDQEYDFYKNRITDEEKLEHIVSCMNTEVHPYIPIENNKETPDIVSNIERKFKPTYGPVTYTGSSGNRVTTKNNVRIAPVYFMLLEKIADVWSSVSTGRLQALGVLSPISKGEKFSHPYRNSSVRTMGESETRIFAGYCGRDAVADMMDRSNNPVTQRNMVWNILNADEPGNIESVIDRKNISLGGSKPIQLVKHVFTVAGFLPVYVPEKKKK